MKKFIALALALMMLFTLAACGKTETPNKPTASANASSNVSTADVTLAENAIGYFSSGVDPSSRETYDIVYTYMRPMALFQNINDALTQLEPQLNFKTTAYCANSDIDALIQTIELYSDQGVDGFICVVDPTASTRIKAALDETGVPYIALMNSVRDENGSEIVPCVGIEGKTAGADTIQWLYDNYKTYWGDIDASEIGLLNFNFSPNADFNDRHNGSLEKFNELLPGNEAKTFTADGVSGKLDEQTGYDLASATLAAHPEVKYWFVAGCIELYSQGAARAVEALGMSDRVLITAVGSDVLPAEWDGGYDGSWKSCLALSAFQYTSPTICALVALMDGKATHDTLWQSKRAEGDQVTFYSVNYQILTKDNYKAFFEQVKKDVGLG